MYFTVKRLSLHAQRFTGQKLLFCVLKSPNAAGGVQGSGSQVLTQNLKRKASPAVYEEISSAVVWYC